VWEYFCFSDWINFALILSQNIKGVSILRKNYVVIPSWLHLSSQNKEALENVKEAIELYEVLQEKELDRER